MMETRQTAAGQMATAQRQSVPAATGWIGWILFAGVIMILGGTFQTIGGLVALFNPAHFLVPSSDLMMPVPYTGWGWTHLIAGILVLLAGFGVMTGQTWARVVGVVLAGISALLHVTSLAAHPVWSVMVITLDIIVSYALYAHGREMQNF